MSVTKVIVVLSPALYGQYWAQRENRNPAARRIKMNVGTAKTVRELALEFPKATRVFEKLGIDYCCGGGKSLEEACTAANLSASQVLESLVAEDTGPSTNRKDREWKSESLTNLIDHIVSTHHKYTREELARLEPLLEKVCRVHGQNHPELLAIRESFRGLAQELTSHMMKEEVILFPYIARMDEAVTQKDPVPPAPFGTVRNPVTMMMHEHDSAGDALRAMRQSSSAYQTPPDACISYQTLYSALAEFEADLHQHIHLENNILFPRAIEMERG
jgi:regulator of cell morphogenesis and NO signaling